MNQRGESGFSIVELVLSMTVGVMLIASLTQITNGYVSLGSKNRNVILSNSFIEGKTETVRNIGYSGLNNGTTDLTSELPAQLPNTKSASMTVTTPTAGLKKVELSITYNDKGKVTTYGYTTYVGEISVLE